MAKLLETYLQKEKEYEKQIADGTLPVGFLFGLQELEYRICVLKTMREFACTAPDLSKSQELAFHYHLVDRYFQFLTKERKLGVKTDDAGNMERETALGSLERIIRDYQKRFASVKVTEQGQYMKLITNAIQTVLAAWIAYRNTYINV